MLRTLVNGMMMQVSNDVHLVSHVKEISKRTADCLMPSRAWTGCKHAKDGRAGILSASRENR